MKTLKQHIEEKMTYTTISNRFEQHSIKRLSKQDAIEATKEWLQEHRRTPDNILNAEKNAFLNNS
jgi:hypothetical protein